MVAWLRNNVVARWILTVVRIWIGYQWISGSLDKLGSPVWTGSKAGVAITGFLTHAVSLAHGPHAAVQGWYASILTGFAIPSAGFMSYLISFGELLIGIALIVGGLTTFAAMMGMILNFSYLLAGTVSTNPNMIIFEIFLVVAGFNAGFYGLDYWIIPWFRKALHYEFHISSGIKGGGTKANN